MEEDYAPHTGTFWAVSNVGICLFKMHAIDFSKTLLILDLDETLIHATPNVLDYEPAFQVFEYHIYLRPHLSTFLQTCTEHFTLAVWSSAGDNYVNEVVKQIIPPTIPLAFVWGRSKCTMRAEHIFEEDHYSPHLGHHRAVKLLKKVKSLGFRLERTLIVDDSPHKAKFNYGNAIYPKPFEGDRADDELLALGDYLTTLKDVENVRKIEKRGWRN